MSVKRLTWWFDLENYMWAEYFEAARTTEDATQTDRAGEQRSDDRVVADEQNNFITYTAPGVCGLCGSMSCSGGCFK